MADFIKLCELIIDSNGNPNVNDVLNCGYTMEHFIKMSQPGVSSERLVHNAKEALKVRGIRYKEVN